MHSGQMPFQPSAQAQERSILGEPGNVCLRDHSCAATSGWALTLGEQINLHFEKVERIKKAGGEAAEDECKGSFMIVWISLL